MLLKATGRFDVAVALAVVVPPNTKVAGVKLMVPMVWLSPRYCVNTDALGMPLTKAVTRTGPNGKPDNAEAVEVKLVLV